MGLDFYNIAGTVNTAFIFVSLYGVFSQLRTICRRKASSDNSVRPTELLSLNQFTVSYLAYLSFFVYGYSISPFNHYIVWPRLIASILVLQIIMEILLDRKSVKSAISFAVAAISLILAFVGLFFGETISDEGKLISTSIILVVSFLLAQGYFHQIRLIYSSGHTGAVDLKMSQFIFMMDISTIIFALSMGLVDGWPLLMLAVTSGVTKLIIMYLFRWVDKSPLAAKRRNAELPQSS
ncbi:hypothetical protein CWC05_07265 [Pseudoalteromonas ruthenica]|uniref:Uncharacterized protein n=2 Tax=Pseudoalteromonas ruthenica TaxID=151081 RepID=A0A5S3Z5Z8_9GAMM|nr:MULTISPECIES: hypothetical protein [Pseudoalteromonas]MCG7566933.1 hypothetical protein [Pseudoalteromonas sp. CnMc7-15]TMP87648.1 hypothetical protein CWC05_07265 [Pseudoalteromonas ruthenica]